MAVVDPTTVGAEEVALAEAVVSSVDVTNVLEVVLVVGVVTVTTT